MPCYEVRLVSVEFKAAHKDLLLEALKQLGLSARVSGNTLYVQGGIEINLDEQRITCPRQQQGLVNRIKQKYSEVVLKKVAEKKKWTVASKGVNKFQLRKWA